MSRKNSLENKALRRQARNQANNQVDETRDMPLIVKLIGGAVLTAVIAIPVIYTSHHRENNNPITVGAGSVAEDSRVISEKRQVYLDDLLKGIEIPFCSGVFYDHDGSKIVDYLISEVQDKGMPLDNQTINFYKEKFRNGNYNSEVPEIFDFSEKGKKSPIFVGRTLFKNKTGSLDFKYILVAHEGRHAEQHARGIGYFNKEELIEGVNTGAIKHPVLYEVCELDANYHALKRIKSGEFKVDRAYQDMKEDYDINRAKLTFVLDKSSDIQKRLITNALEATELTNP